MIQPIATTAIAPPSAPAPARRVTAPATVPAAGAGDRILLASAPRASQPAATVSLVAEAGGPDPLEARMIALVNRDRAENGLPPLQHDPRLTVIALAHSEDMAQHDFFDHTSPTTGKMGDRYKAAGYQSLTSAENLAINSSIEAAQDALMHSPGHRKNLLNPTVTHIGIGIKVTPLPGGRAQYTITQNFAKPYVPRSDADWRQDMRTAISASRQTAGMPDLGPDAALDTVVDAVAADIAANGYDPNRVKKLLNEGLKQAGITHRGYGLEYRTMYQPSDAQAPDTVTDPAVARIGVGLAQKPGAKGDLPQTVALTVNLLR